MNTFLGWLVGFSLYACLAGILSNFRESGLIIFLMFGALIAGVVSGFAVTSSLNKRKERMAKEECQREADEAARKEADARAARTYDFRELATAFDRAKPSSRSADGDYLQNVVAVALGGGDVGRNEFERREFHQVRESKVREIKATPRLCCVRVGAYFLDYDFERNCFPVTIRIYDSIRVLPRRPGANGKDNEIEGVLPMTLDKAEHFRSSLPPVETVMIILRPEGGSRHGNSHGVLGELLGLRPINSKTRSLLEYP